MILQFIIERRKKYIQVIEYIKYIKYGTVNALLVSNLKINSPERMMRNTVKIILGLALAIIGSQAQALTVSGLCTDGVDCYWGPSGAPANQPSIADIEALVGVTDLFEAYKKEVDGGSEEGSSFATSYDTTFTGDPNGGTIKYTGGDSISCPNCFLLVKGGKDTPNWFVFDISSWDGIEDIIMENFWNGPGGAISNVVIFVPEPGILALLGLGLVGLGLRRLKKVS